MSAGFLGLEEALETPIRQRCAVYLVNLILAQEVQTVPLVEGFHGDSLRTFEGNIFLDCASNIGDMVGSRWKAPQPVVSHARRSTEGLLLART
jgi:hypothetical protein